MFRFVGDRPKGNLQTEIVQVKGGNPVDIIATNAGRFGKLETSTMAEPQGIGP